jgi:spermidine/putrescine transport system ATP-binding protein
MPEPAVELRHLSKSFADHVAVESVSLRIAGGEFFSLLGSSGCGKSTTLRMIAGFEHPSAGDILLNGQSVAGKPVAARDLNLVFQNYALFPHMTVADNVAFGLRMEKVAAAEIDWRVREALAMVHLEGFERRLPRQLSGGQQQRAALARAIVTRPALLLLDEPLGALDLKLRRAMQAELKAIQRRLGMTFIYVTHDQEEALAVSDRVAVMHQGRVLQVDAPQALYERPANRFVAEFIGESNLLEARVDAVSDLRTEVSIGPLRLGLTCETCPAVGSAITVSIRPEKIDIQRAPTAAAGNVCAATVEEAVYLGTDTRYRMRVTDSLSLVVQEQNRGVPLLAPGAVVAIELPAAHLRVLGSDGHV